MLPINAIPAQTSTGAVLEIIVLLLIAGLISWLTCYFYYRSIFRRKRAELEDIIRSRDEMIVYLEREKSNLLLRNTELEKEIESQKMEIVKLKETLESNRDKPGNLEK